MAPLGGIVNLVDGLVPTAYWHGPLTMLLSFFELAFWARCRILFLNKKEFLTECHSNTLVVLIIGLSFPKTSPSGPEIPASE